jgi:streptogramin lyase
MFLSRPALLLSLLLIGFLRVPVMAQDLSIGSWRTHLPYKQGLALADAGNEIYCLSNVTFFSFDKTSGEIQKYDKVLGLSDVKVVAIEYSKEYSTLVVVYDNANIDLIKNNTIINISDIKRKSITGEKRIYNIHFAGSLAYLSTSFGIVVLNIDKQEVKDTYYIGDNGNQLAVYDITTDGSLIYAATEAGVKYAPLNAVNLANYQEWTLDAGLPADTATQIITFQNQVLVNMDDSLYRRENGVWSFFYEQPGWTINHLNTSATHLLVSEVDVDYNGRIARFDANLGFASPLIDSDIRVPRETIVDADSTTWVADEINGLLRLNGPGRYRVGMNGPGSTSTVALSAARGKLWQAAGPTRYQNTGFLPDQGFAKYEDNSWRYFDLYNTPELANFQLVHEILASPTEDKVYIGSYWGGLLEYTNDSIKQYDQTNSILQEQTGNQPRVGVTGLALDAQNNLWMSNYLTNAPLVVKKADGSWKSFNLPQVNAGRIGQLVIDDNNFIWGTIEGAAAQGIVVYDCAGTIDDVSDDQYRVLTTAAGNGGLPNNEVVCLAKDREGEIWAGTSGGVAVFYCPGSVFTDQGCDAQQILVSEGGFAGYLLSTEYVSVIKVDGANRKWVGTNNGLWLFSADGTKQLAYYNVDNSPLLSNEITSIAIDDESGEVFVGSFAGMVSLRGEATAATEEFASECLVFPNPVRETYTGPIAISGLAQDSEVKITDITGTLIYQTNALGGQAVWNGQDYTGREAKSGVYLVFAINSDGSASKVCKFLLMR